VQCWGKNDVGQLGNSSNTDSNIPVAVTGLTGIASISAGDEHTCSLSTIGAALCWGGNGSGRLGNDPNTVIFSNVPLAVAPLIFGPPKSITAGGSHTCAVDAQDGLECWGDNTLGQLGDGTNTLSSTPLVVSPPLDTGVALGAAGESHTCAVTTTGGAMCWGSNAAGELGNGLNTPSNVPVDVTGMTTGVASISSGANLTCSLSTLGAVSCWGNIFVFTGTPTFTIYLPLVTVR
jgi:alpha-tubulin suppressor-like RCC1 family protein